ncbi:hypothetical protein [Phragmitibacter flavus]|nr:hypothetical protein [Phragmitibacter flavus]
MPVAQEVRPRLEGWIQVPSAWVPQELRQVLVQESAQQESALAWALALA